MSILLLFFFFFFNDTAPTEIYPLSLHDALPIWDRGDPDNCGTPSPTCAPSLTSAPATVTIQVTPNAGVTSTALAVPVAVAPGEAQRSEEHTSELQSRLHLVCRLLLEKKKTKTIH